MFVFVPLMLKFMIRMIVVEILNFLICLQNIMYLFILLIKATKLSYLIL